MNEYLVRAATTTERLTESLAASVH